MKDPDALVRSATQLAFLLDQRGTAVQDERVDVCAKLGDDGRHLVRHQFQDEMHVAAESIGPSRGIAGPAMPSKFVLRQ